MDYIETRMNGKITLFLAIQRKSFCHFLGYVTMNFWAKTPKNSIENSHHFLGKAKELLRRERHELLAQIAIHISEIWTRSGDIFPWEKMVDFSIGKWIGLRENLQETMVFTIKYRGFL